MIYKNEEVEMSFYIFRKLIRKLPGVVIRRVPKPSVIKEAALGQEK